MSIGMITFHRAQNIGANLQSYALNRFIIENVGHCEIIDYYPNNQTAHKHKVRRLLGAVKSHVFADKYKAYLKFCDFQNKNYVLSHKSYYGDADIKKCAPKYDVLISGSDQILNTTLSKKSTAYYLDFDDNAKKVSYASSFGRENITSDEVELIKTELVKFNKLSVREMSAGGIIKAQIGVNCDFVLDPVFLLSEEQWMGLEKQVKIPSKYILAYAMEVTEIFISTLEMVKKEFNLPVIVIYGCKDNHCIDGTKISDCGPSEFLSYIDNASVVVTNSFHGISFSLIFGKKVICVAHSVRNARLQNIMTLIENQSKLVDNLIEKNIKEYIVDCYAESAKLLPLIESSKRYLFSALKE